MRRLDVNPHPARIGRPNQLADVFRGLGMPANHLVYISGRQYIFGFSFPESVSKYFQFAGFLGELQSVVARTFDDRSVFQIDASFNKGRCT